MPPFLKVNTLPFLPSSEMVAPPCRERLGLELSAKVTVKSASFSWLAVDIEHRCTLGKPLLTCLFNGMHNSDGLCQIRTVKGQYK